MTSLPQGSLPGKCPTSSWAACHAASAKQTYWRQEIVLMEDSLILCFFYYSIKNTWPVEPLRLRNNLSFRILQFSIRIALFPLRFCRNGAWHQIPSSDRNEIALHIKSQENRSSEDCHSCDSFYSITTKVYLMSSHILPLTSNLIPYSSSGWRLAHHTLYTRTESVYTLYERTESVFWIADESSKYPACKDVRERTIPEPNLVDCFELVE